jgi:hypothetical protein
MSINPAVGRVSRRRWRLHVGVFALGVSIGALATYVAVRALYVLVATVSPAAWLAVALPMVGLAAVHDLGMAVPIPYPARRQVPEWLRRVAPPGVTAAAFGAQLGTGFLTRFTYSTHTGFVALLATQAPPVVVGSAVLIFALTKSIVVATSSTDVAPASHERMLLGRFRLRGQGALRVANGVLTIATAAVLLTNV